MATMDGKGHEPADGRRRTDRDIVDMLRREQPLRHAAHEPSTLPSSAAPERTETPELAEPAEMALPSMIHHETKRPKAPSRAAPARKLPWKRLSLHGAGVVATALAWVLLVYLAVTFGNQARAGESGDWLFLVLATLGAIVCLFACLSLAARAWSVATTTKAPRASRGGKRARR